MAVLETLDAAAVRLWGHTLCARLADHSDEIDDVNVFPVPDGDTGTNLVSTARAAAEALDAEPSIEAGVLLAAMARGGVLGARGNSGVIMAQLLCGLADSATGLRTWDGPGVRAGLALAYRQAYAAVDGPVEGTILTVLRAAADGAARAGDALGDVVGAALGRARSALTRTTGQLPELAAAGVVDAGGLGLVVVLDALHMVVSGRPTTLPARAATVRATPARSGTVHGGVLREGGSEGFAYEVQYLLRAEAPAVAALERKLSELGGSLVVVGTGAGEWNVHVHVDDVGAAIEAGVEAGQPRRITVTRFADQRGAGAGLAGGEGVEGVAIVAVSPGEGLAEVFRAEGVHVADGGGPGGPTVPELLHTIRATGVAAVILLAGARADGVAQRAAEQARRAGFTVAVVPIRSPVQGLAAVAVHQPSRRFEDDVIAMAESAAATRWAEVTVAARESLTMAGRCQPGDVLGLIDGEVVTIGADVVVVAEWIIDRLLGVGGELVTVLVGTKAPAGAGATIAAHVVASAPHVEVAVLTAGQPGSPLLIGVE